MKFISLTRLLTPTVQTESAADIPPIECSMQDWGLETAFWKNQRTIKMANSWKEFGCHVPFELKNLRTCRPAGSVSRGTARFSYANTFDTSKVSSFNG
jgi:hypothetical protein